jgi:hypothetical protein
MTFAVIPGSYWPIAQHYFEAYSPEKGMMEQLAAHNP